MKKKFESIKKLSLSKLFLILLFLNFFALEIFVCGITLYSFSVALAIGLMPDFTPLVTLIGAIIGQTLSYGIYIQKSKAENTANGLVFEKAMRELDYEFKEGINNEYNSDQQIDNDC